MTHHNTIYGTSTDSTLPTYSWFIHEHRLIESLKLQQPRKKSKNKKHAQVQPWTSRVINIITQLICTIFPYCYSIAIRGNRKNFMNNHGNKKNKGKHARTRQLEKKKFCLGWRRTNSQYQINLLWSNGAYLKHMLKKTKKKARFDHSNKTKYP